MNTTSLLLNGRTATSISLLPERQAATLTTLTVRRQRPAHKRASPSTPNRNSPGWYNTDGGLTLDDFARRLNTRISKFEQWQGRCAQNVVMALMRPTPVSLFLFNPMALLIYLGLVVWWVSARLSGEAEGVRE